LEDVFYQQIYVFQVHVTNKSILISGGKGFFNSLKGINSFDVLHQEKIDMSDEDVEKVEQVLPIIQSYTQPLGPAADDAWDVEIITADHKILFTYGAANNAELDELVSWLIEKAPFEIVDEFGNKVLPI
jgi:hypothetical protein